MTALWSSGEASEATGGRATADWRATGVSIDTRTLAKGDLFVALRAARDGHDFVAEALRKGAAAAMVDRVPDGVAGDAPLLIVDDVMAALTALGRAGRARSGARVIAVTGSVGKTSTKEMLRHVLSFQGATHAAEASYNNHWGVPLTLARMPRDARFAVVEIGMNHPGEIAPLARLARPHVALVTTVGAAHLEAFDGIGAIAREKASIFEGLEDGGTAILHADLEVTPVLRDVAARHAARIVGFGESEGAEHRAVDIALHETGSVVTVETGGERRHFKLGQPGRHVALNALGALAAVEAAGGDVDMARLDIATWTPPGGRGGRETLELDAPMGWTAELLDDAFNANPGSMAAAFEVLAGIAPRNGVGRASRGRRIAVLGDMLELGPAETEMHAGLARHPAMARIDVVHTVGPRMRALHDALDETRRGRHAERAEDMAAVARQLVDAGDVILVKGSKGSRVSLVVDALRRIGQGAVKREAP